QLVGLRDVVVRLEVVRRRQRARVEEVDGLLHVETAPAAVLVAAVRAFVTAVRGVDVVGVPLEDLRDLAARERRVEADEDGGGRGHLRGRKRRAFGVLVFADRAGGVALFLA